MSKAQEPTTPLSIVPALITRVVAVALAALAIAAGVSSHEEPASRFVVLQCQGFDALAGAADRPATCNAGLTRGIGDAPESADGDVGARAVIQPKA